MLTPQEAKELFEIIRGLTAQGKSIIFISHKLNEVTEVADRITVLRRGKKIETLPAAGRDRGEPRAADGRPRGAAARREGRRRTRPSRCSRSRTCTSFDDRGIEKVRGVSLDVRAGEIVGIAGIDGNGQTELIDAMTGLRKVAAGTVTRRRRGRHARQRLRPLRRRPRPHPRGPAAARARARVLDRREHRAARLPPARRTRGSAGSSRAA